MPIVRIPPEAVISYELSDAINQSGLKEIMYGGIQSFLANKEALAREKKYFESKDHFRIGTAVDTLMSFDREHFDKVYHTSTLEKKPSDTMMTVLHMVLERLNNEPQIFRLGHTLYNPIIHECLNQVQSRDSKTGEIKIGHYMNRAKATWQEDGRMKDVLENIECINYWNDIVTARGKQVLSISEKEMVDRIVLSWKTHRNTQHLFENRPNVVTIYQLPLYFVVNDVQCKGLIDKLDVHLELGYISPQDLKTMTGFTLEFPRKSMRARRYDIQGAFYTEAVRQNLHTISQIVGKDVSNFDIKNFKFIVESTTNPGLPLQFQMDDVLMERGRTGHGQEFLKGYEQLIEEYSYWANHGFNVESAVDRAVETGVLTVDSEFNYIKP